MGYIRFMAMLLLVLPLNMAAQVGKRPSRAAIDSLLNPVLCGNADKIVLFDKIKENIGTIYESDSARTIRFTFRNVASESLCVTAVTTHCGCTASAFATEPVASGETSVIEVTYNPKGRSGTIDTNAFVYTSLSGKQPVAKLTILGNVIDNDEWSHLSHAMGKLKLKRKDVSFANIKPGTFPEARIVCANVGTRPLELSSRVLPSYATFFTEPAILQPGEEGDVVIRINADKFLSVNSGQTSFSVIVDGVEGTPSSRTIKAVINKNE